MSDINFLVYLHSMGFSQRKLFSIFYNSQNYRQIFEDISFDSLKKLGFSDKQIEKILLNKNKLDTQAIDTKIVSLDIKIITLHDIDYPKQLKEIANIPYVLYVQGHLNTQPCLSVIGSRSISSYGKRIIQKILPELSKNFTIVSGGAYGCDSEAHVVCIESSGTTYAVIGTGIDIVYPATNAKLYQKIVRSAGAIISIFPLGEKGNPHNFPIRNEIISGLSLGVLVIEAAEKSGTLITAKLALDQGKDVFAIAGEIDKQNSIGCNLLLKRGEAKFTTHPRDIFEEYPFLRYTNSSQKNISLTHNQKNICDILGFEPVTIDILVQKLSQDIATISREISLLEIKKIIRKNTEGKYEIS